MNTMNVKPHIAPRQSKMIVVAGSIVDGITRIACDPYWLQWQASNAPVTDYVPFQNVQPHKCVCAEYREDWIGA